jgi:uncharacterized protein
MKSKKIFLLLFFINLVASAQHDTTKMEFKQFFFPGGKISSEGYFRNNQPDGYWKTYYEDGTIKSEGNRKNFLLDGVWKFYNTEGNLTLEVEYKEDKKHGRRISYHKDMIVSENFENDIKQGFTYHYYPEKKIKKEIFFIDGLEEGFSREYDTSGLAVVLYQYKKGFLLSREIINRKNSTGKKHGLWMNFYESGEIKRTEEWSNGFLNGFVKDFEKNGNLMNIEKYVNGEQQFDAEELKVYDIRYDYYPNGRVKIMGSYRNDLPDGVRREYNKEGKIEKGYIFREGKMIAEGIIDEKGLRQGFFKEYYETGQLMAEGKYENSKPVGNWKYYYPDGHLEQEGTFDSRSRQTGEWVWYHQNGNLWKKEYFENGIPEGEYIEYDITGKIIVKGEYFDGAETGHWFWEIGDVREEGSFIDGNYNGSWKITDLETGNVIFEGKYLDGNPNGKHVYYWPEGKKRIEGSYVMGRREGDWFHYNSEGQLFLRIYYRRGIEQKFDNVMVIPQIEED